MRCWRCCRCSRHSTVARSGLYFQAKVVSSGCLLSDSVNTSFIKAGTFNIALSCSLALLTAIAHLVWFSIFRPSAASQIHLDLTCPTMRQILEPI